MNILRQLKTRKWPFLELQKETSYLWLRFHQLTFSYLRSKRRVGAINIQRERKKNNRRRNVVNRKSKPWQNAKRGFNNKMSTNLRKILSQTDFVFAKRPGEKEGMN